LASPHLGDALKAKGMTSYLVPLSRPPQAVVMPAKPSPAGAPAVAAVPETIFDNPEGTTFPKITDGTSNTILVVEAHPSAAVIWTKPDDLVIDEKDLFRGLRDQPNNAFAAVFADGHVRTISTSVNPQTLLHLFQMNDGNPIGGF
jgi:prepilin-type processing-associated H-X9-DG protein